MAGLWALARSRSAKVPRAWARATELWSCDRYHQRQSPSMNTLKWSAQKSHITS